jgi:hypothetical protein
MMKKLVLTEEEKYLQSQRVLEKELTALKRQVSLFLANLGSLLEFLDFSVHRTRQSL